MKLSAETGTIRIGIIAATYIGAPSERSDISQFLYKHAELNGISHIIHNGGLFGPSFCGNGLAPTPNMLERYPRHPGITTIYYPFRHSASDTLPFISAREDWVVLPAPSLEIVGPDGTAIPCDLVFDPHHEQYRAQRALPPDAGRDRVVLFGGRCHSRGSHPPERYGHKVLVMTGSCAHGPRATVSVLDLEILTEGRVGLAGSRITTLRLEPGWF